MAKKTAGKPKAETPVKSAPAPAPGDASPTPEQIAANDAAQVQTAGEAIVEALTGADDDAAVRNLIHRCERAGTTGHGLDSDRELLKEAGAALRFFAGILDEDVAPVPGAYAPVEETRPIGHSLPDTKTP